MSGSIRELPTSIGPPLRFDGEVWSIDVSEVPTLHGLSVLSRALSEMVTAQARSDRLAWLCAMSGLSRPELACACAGACAGACAALPGT